MCVKEWRACHDMAQERQADVRAYRQRRRRGDVWRRDSAFRPAGPPPEKRSIQVVFCDDIGQSDISVFSKDLMTENKP